MNTATYSPEDNKLRLYVGRVPREDYLRLKKAGFTSTPKQDCDFVATWTPQREDICREFLEDGEDIGDEGYSMAERSADRAERFEGYREKRTAEAIGHADTFDAGPAVFGHQNRARAERQAARHDQHRSRAVSQWSKAEYWQQRTAGVIAHALYKSRPDVRRGRILTIEADQRKLLANIEEAREKFENWRKVLTLDGADVAIRQTASRTEATGSGHVIHLPQLIEPTPAQKLAYHLANYKCHSYDYKHPRTGQESSLYSHLTNALDPITPREAAELYLSRCHEDGPGRPGSYADRWRTHYELRLGYENAMLANEGGMAGDVEMIPGGWIRSNPRGVSCCISEVPGGWLQIQAVNKSPATGRVTSVKVWGTYTPNGCEPQRRLLSMKIDRLGENCYRAPTPEELETFKAEQKAEKKAAKASKPKAPQLINPTPEAAQRLQDHWNARAKEKHAEAKARYSTFSEFVPQTVREMTQAEYSAASKLSHSHFETVEVCVDGHRQGRSIYRDDRRAVLFKVRKTYGKGDYSHKADRVIVITDKPQKDLPAWGVEAEAEAVTV